MSYSLRVCNKLRNKHYTLTNKLFKLNHYLSKNEHLKHYYINAVLDLKNEIKKIKTLINAFDKSKDWKC